MPALPQPPTYDELIDVLRDTMDGMLLDQAEADPAAWALIEGEARRWAYLARRIYLMAGASWVLPWPGAPEPASLEQRSAMTAVMRRVADAQRGVVMLPGTVTLEGPQGRLYRNRDRIEWDQGDRSDQAVLFEAEAPGWFYDLDFLANDDGFVTDPSDETQPWRDVLWYAELGTRSGDAGEIRQVPEGWVLFENPANGDRFNGYDPGRYVQILSAGQPANRGRLLRIVDVVETDGDRGALLAEDGEPIRPFVGVSDYGGLLAREQGPFGLTRAALAVDDAYYFGLHTPFVWLDLELVAGFDGEAEFVWEYYRNGSWVELPELDDGSLGLVQSGRVAWPRPPQWSTVTVAGLDLYWVRLRCTSVTTQGAVSADSALLGATLSLVNDTEVSWSVPTWEALGFSFTSFEAASGGRLDTLSLRGREVGVERTEGEDVEIFRKRIAGRVGAVTLPALQDAVDRVLDPYGVRGFVFDPMSDAYGALPGAAAPVLDDPPEMLVPTFYDQDLAALGPEWRWNTYFASWQLTRHVFVLLPLINLGHDIYYGEDGPVWVLPEGDYMAATYGQAYYDTRPDEADRIEGSIRQDIEALTPGGVSATFEIVPELLGSC